MRISKTTARHDKWINFVVAPSWKLGMTLPPFHLVYQTAISARCGSNTTMAWSLGIGFIELRKDELTA